MGRREAGPQLTQHTEGNIVASVKPHAQESAKGLGSKEAFTEPRTKQEGGDKGRKVVCTKVLWPRKTKAGEGEDNGQSEVTAGHLSAEGSNLLPPGHGRH